MSTTNNVGFDNDVVNDDLLVTNVKGHHRFIKKVEGVKKFIDVYTTKYTPGSNIRCAITGHIFNDYKVGSCDEDLFLKVCLAGLLPDTSTTHGKFLYYSHPKDYEQHFDITLDENVVEKWKVKFSERMKYHDDIRDQNLLI